MDERKIIFLNGIKKSALLLLCINSNEITDILKLFTKSEIEILIEAMFSLNNKELSLIENVIDEYKEFLKQKDYIVKNIKNRMTDALQKVLGKEKSKSILKKSLIKYNFLNNIEYLNSFSAEYLFSIFKKEHNQVISVILIYLKKKLSIQIFLLFSASDQKDILNRCSIFKGIDILGIIELNNLIKKIKVLKKFCFISQRGLEKSKNLILSFKNTLVK